MRGMILAIAPDGSYGQLSAEDGQRYSYWTSEVRNGPVQVGQGVDFQMWEGQPVDIFVLTRAVGPSAPVSQAAVRPAAYGSGGVAQAVAAIPAAYAATFSSMPPLEYWITLFTSPLGRISRQQFWLHGVLPIVVCSLVFGWIPLLGFLVSLAIAWAGLCISFKRFHDLGYPGWWSLLNMIPVVLAASFTAGSLLGLRMMWTIAQGLWGLALVVWIVQMVLVYLRVGQQGPNQYGPDPLSGM
jgi:uncharacterized membrane protein YhaH (DUF805 family)